MVKVLIVDQYKCEGCNACALACSVIKEGEANLLKSRIKITRFVDVRFNFQNVCLQCDTPYCAMVCPTSALDKCHDTGLVEFYEEKCVGCKLCLLGCPFGAISMVDGKIMKCDLCEGDPTCVKLCPWDALDYGDAKDIGADRRTAVAEKMRDAKTEAPSG